jgi:hypothetical protein
MALLDIRNLTVTFDTARGPFAGLAPLRRR